MRFFVPFCQLIGAGRAGSALSLAMTRAGYRFNWIGAKHTAHAVKLAKQIGASASGVGIEGFHDKAGFLIIAVPDDEIVHAASDAVAHGVISKGTIAAHLSGALGSEVLHELRTSGASVMAFHPAQTITYESDPESVFAGIFFDMEGDDAACALGERIAHDLGALSLRLTPEQRVLSHAAMTVASNYTVSVLYMAEEIMMAAGIPIETARKMLMPLFLNTTCNISASGTLDALTGPVSRGDVTVINRHLDALAHMGNDCQTVYKKLALIALRMAEKRDAIPEKNLEEIRKLLTKV